MADDNLRIRAEVVDGFTAPLGRMETALRRTEQVAKQAAKDAQSDWAPFATGIGRARTALEGLNPVLGAVGIGSAGAALALGGTITALRHFSVSTRDAALLAKELGMTTNELRAFGRVGEEVGVSANTMQGGIKNFQEQLSQLRKRWGETYIQLEGMGLGGLVEKMISAPNMRRAVEEAIQGLATITDPVKRRKVAQMIFGAEEFARVAAEYGVNVKKVVADTMDEIGTIGPGTEQAAKRFEQNVGRMSDAWEKLKITVLGGGLEGAFKVIDDFDKNGLSGNEQEQALRKQLNPDFTPQQKLESRRSSVQQQLDLLDRNPSPPDYQRKRDRMTEELKRVADELEKLRNQGATVQQQSFNGPLGGGGARIIQASLRGGGIPGMGQGFGLGGSGAQGAAPEVALPRGGGGGGGSGGSAPLEGNIAPLAPGGGSAPLALGGGSALRGDGRGNRGAAAVGDMMRYAMDQLRREGVPEQHLRQSAAHLVGQAYMESGLNPNTVHDGGTGLGIYGARDPKGWGNYPGARRSAMVRWLEANGYARNSAEGQMRYMAHEAMGGGYRATRRILMGEGTGNLETDTNKITGEFEAPKHINRRSPAVANAYRTGPSEAGSSELSGAPDGEKNTGMSRLRDSDIERLGAGERMGDAMMRRLYGRSAPVMDGPMSLNGSASLHIKFENAPAGMRTSVKTDGIIRNVTTTKQRQLAI